MKKIIVVIFLLAGGCMLRAQSITEIKVYVYSNKFEKGKTELDKFLSNPANANNAEAWFYKAIVYNALSLDSARSFTDRYALNQGSFEAIKKYSQLDPKETLTKEEKNETIFNVYYVYYDFGVKAFNVKDYNGAYDNFKNALDVHDYIFTNNLEGPKGGKFATLDTALVWNLAILSNELKKNNEVFGYYKKIVDNNLHDPQYLEAYEGLLLNYKKEKDQASFNIYLEKGKANYPKEQFWQDIEIEDATNSDVINDALFKKYDEMAAKYPNSYLVFYNYAVMLTKFVNADENKNTDLKPYKNKLPEELKKAISINSTVEANMLLANYYYNNYFDITDDASKIKGTKADDVKKKTELTNAAKKSLDDCIPYAEAAADLYGKMPKLKASEKNYYRQTCDMLIEIYRVKGNAAKSAEYKVKKDAIL